ncbi:hypothetical protein FHW96_000311 [Novosphingobium sp. SG751A]|uniref:copper resistance protein CopC n=1 Tax=Novosphingobium sp. SG751A TaxID=2587000 RepID=UPI0015569603|nr:copper resistance protein CopC [Novosphingobium sp. SG751A]NOW44184.1 hypothetical protein [Novosphingobium sp. SG751A]
MRFLILPLIAIATPAIATPAMATPALTSASPAEGSDTANITRITLNFSEAVDPAASGVDVMMTGMPGMDHHDPMKMAGVKVAVSPDGRSLVATLARPLSEGTYVARWHVADKSAQKADGALTFNTH